MKTAIVCLAAGAALLAQTQGRDSPATVMTGTSRISGVVLSDDAEARPIRMATITLTSQALNQWPLLSTDDDGRFDFDNLPAGRFVVSAKKAGYLPMEYGARRPGGDGIPLAIAAGQHTRVTIKLSRGGVITGTLTGPDGEPASDVRLFLFRNQPNQFGGSSVELGGPSGWRGQPRTDDRGVYRFYGVFPGEYYVVAVPFTPTGVQISESDLESATRLVRGGAATNDPQPSSSRGASLTSIFYPGLIDPASATPVTIGAGEERTGIDFTLQYAPTSTISGTIVDAEGIPAQAVQGNLLSPGVSVFLLSPSTIHPDADGRFSRTGVIPGRYTLVVSGSASTNRPPGSAIRAGSKLWARMDLVIDGRDQEGLGITLQSGVPITGQILFDGRGTPPPRDLTSVRIVASPLQTPTTVTISTDSVAANTDGTFTLPDVAPGSYRLNASVGGSTWSLRSSVVAGRDSLDEPFDLRQGEPVSGAVITFTDQPSELTGTLLDTAGQPVSLYAVIIFSADRAHWLVGSRRVRMVTPSTTGTFRVFGLPPGDYCAAAVPDPNRAVLYTPGFLDPLIPASIKITLAEGEKKTLDLRVKKDRE